MRQLTASEISALQQQGCCAENWNTVKVSEGFSTQHIHNTCFSGLIELGVFQQTFTFADGFSRHAGICNANLHNCKVADDCYIGNVRDRIANYNIGAKTYINNVGLITVEKECSFGNGVQVAAINEGGGREITIYDQLSSHTAFFVAAYRNKTSAVAHLEQLAAAYTEQQKSSTGSIGEGATIVNCNTIKGVKVGNGAKLNGCSWLENGTISSSVESPAEVGADVIAHDFIFCKKSEVGAGAQILRCFVGEGSLVGEQFAATDCFISCNCQFFHGEGASVFAGPYSVSHHKATLLIAGAISFFNAGSGSNQSNHAYKLGPNHQGILDRGSKLASSSYLLWPAHLGAFTTVLGCHKEHPDTTELPFSYLLEKNGVPYVLPAANLRSVGTMRDADKWPKRDCRNADCKLDTLTLDMLNPFTMAQVIKGAKVLEDLLANAGQNECVQHKGLNIKVTAAGKGLRLYRLAIAKYKGDVLAKHPNCTNSTATTTEWYDLGGCILPVSALGELEKVASVAELNAVFESCGRNYAADEWNWAVQQFPELNDKAQHAKVISEWENAVATLNTMAITDAEKEYAPASMLGYGLDPDGENAQADFAAVRGKFDDNSFIKQLRS